MKRLLIPYILSALTLTLGTVSVASTAQARQRGTFRVAFVGDPQVNDSTEMSYARKSIYKELSERKDIDFALFLGDLVNDNMQLLPESVRIIESLPYRCMMIPGNHDRDVYKGTGGQVARARDLSTWTATVGYIDTSFCIRNIRFILMNNVRARNRGMSDYEGGFTERQRHWLDSVFNRTPEMLTRGNHTNGNGIGTPSLTILATHIPFSQMKGQDSVIAMIPDVSRVLFVSGHTHSVARNELKITKLDGATVNTEEVIAGATCGSWWRGVKDENGIPYAVQNCGAPRGYFVADIYNDGRYKLDYKCVGKSEHEKLSVWLVKEEMTSEGVSKKTETSNAGAKDGAKGGSNNALYCKSGSNFRLYTNVYGGSANGNVDIDLPRKVLKQLKVLCDSTLSGGLRVTSSVQRGSFNRRLSLSVCSKTAPEVMEIIDLNAAASREYRKAHRDEFIPLRRKPSPHLWESEAFSLSPDKIQISPSSDKLQAPTRDSIDGHRKVAFYVTVRYCDPQMKIRQRRVPVYIY